VQNRVSGQSRHEDWSGQSTSEWNQDKALEVAYQLDGRAVRPCDHKDLDNLAYETRVSELLEDQDGNRDLLELVRQTVNWGNHQHPITKESKTLSYVGRHCPEAPRIGTWVPVAYLRNTHRHAFKDPLKLAACLLFNEKNRFMAKIVEVGVGRRVFIASVQGHGHGITVDRADVQTRVSEQNMPRLAVHGTTWHAFHRICQEGLAPGGPLKVRNDVHFATSLPGPGEVVSGLRRRSEVHIFLDVEAFVGDGHECYLTPNNVLVTPEHVETRYFKYVTDSTDPSVDILSNKSVPQEYRISCGMTVREDAIYQVPRHSNSPERASSSAAADSRERASASAIDQEIEPALEIEERIPTGDTEDEAEREEEERRAAVRPELIDSVNKFFNGEEISDLRFDVISVVTQETMTEMGMGDRFQELQDLIQERRVIREAIEESQEAGNVVDRRTATASEGSLHGLPPQERHQRRRPGFRILHERGNLRGSGARGSLA
jgi:RNA:NAD 2'-phosphotransferase (TPT1/KptA family)